MLKTLNMTPAEVRKAVIALDEFVLPRHALDQLLKFIPTDDEVRPVLSPVASSKCAQQPSSLLGGAPTPLLPCSADLAVGPRGGGRCNGRLR